MAIQIEKVTLPEDPIRAGREGEVVRAVDGLRELGFILVEAPELEATTRAVYAAGAAFFALPDDVKRSYYNAKAIGERGYSPRRDETGLLCRALGPDGEKLSDEKEFFAVGLAPEDLKRKGLQVRWPDFYHPNEYPPIDGFKSAMENQRTALMRIGAKVLRAVAARFGRRLGHFDRMLEDGASMMRLLRYPSLAEEELAANPVWGCSHRDLSFVTVLSRGEFLGDGPDDPEAGLWIKPNDVDLEDKASWVRGVAPPGYAFVQVGNLLEIYSKGVIRSAYHEIRAPTVPNARPRMSTSVFMHVRPDIVVDADTGMKAGTYVREELRKIELAMAA